MNHIVQNMICLEKQISTESLEIKLRDVRLSSSTLEDRRLFVFKCFNIKENGVRIRGLLLSDLLFISPELILERTVALNDSHLYRIYACTAQPV